MWAIFSGLDGGAKDFIAVVFSSQRGGCMAVLKMPPSLSPGANNAVSSSRSRSHSFEPKVPALSRGRRASGGAFPNRSLTVQGVAVWERFLWRDPYLERVRGVLDGAPRGPVCWTPPAGGP